MFPLYETKIEIWFDFIDSHGDVMKVILNPGLSNNPTIYSLPINYDFLKISNSFDKMSWHVFAQRPFAPSIRAEWHKPFMRLDMDLVSLCANKHHGSWGTDTSRLSSQARSGEAETWGQWCYPMAPTSTNQPLASVSVLEGRSIAVRITCGSTFLIFRSF